MPAQPVDRRCPLGDKDIAASSQQLQLPRDLIMGGHGQVGLAQHRPGHRLASMGSDLPLVRADLRTWANFVGTRTTCWSAPSRSRSRRADMLRQSSTPHFRSAPNCSCAHISALKCPTLWPHGLPPERAAHLVDSDEGVFVLVYIGANKIMVTTSFSLWMRVLRLGRSADTSQSGRSHAPIKSGRPVRLTRCRHYSRRQPEGDRRKMSQTPGDPEPTTASPTCHAGTPQTRHT